MIWALLFFLGVQGRPLFYWGARPPVIAREVPPPSGAQARVAEVHMAVDRVDLVVRLTFDRPVAEAMSLPDGTPVSGRLSAVLYIDSDADDRTGLGQAEPDLRAGADRRLEIGVVYIGEDPAERRPASAVLTATLAGLTRRGSRRVLWRRDSAANPDQVSARGAWVEVRVPAARVGLEPHARIILTEGHRSWEGPFER